MQKSEKMIPSQSEKCFSQKDEFHSNKSKISLLWWYLTHFTLSRVNFSLFLESDHSNHSFSSERV